MQLPTHQPAAKCPLILLGALASFAFPALSLASPAPQIVTAEVVAYPGAASGVDRFESVAADGEGSWVAGVSLISGSPGTALYGLLASSGASTPSILRVPQTLAGRVQETIFSPEVRDGRIAYTSFDQSSSGGFSSWVDDSLIAAEGVAIGNTGLEWLGSGTPMLSDGQAIYVRGFGQPVGGGAVKQFVVRYPSEQVVLETGMSIPQLSGPIETIKSFDPRPSGTSWVASVTYISGNTGVAEEAVLLNGGLLQVTPGLRANTEGTSFESFGDVSVDDNFNVVFEAVDFGGAAVYRGGRPVFRSSGTRILAVDGASRVVSADPFIPGHGIQFEGISLDRPGVAVVDADGDGDGDAGWALSGNGVSFGSAGFLASGEVLALADVQAPGLGVDRAIIKATLLPPDDVVCDGAPNSTGEGADLRAVGSTVPAFNDLRLRVTNLPVLAPFVPLFSRTTGFTANPAGSQGNLCLSGSIGRGTLGFPAGATNSATFQVLPTAIPQPNGFVAAQPGETWYFQLWYRDSISGNATSNFTSAVSLTFR